MKFIIFILSTFILIQTKVFCKSTEFKIYKQENPTFETKRFQKKNGKYNLKSYIIIFLNFILVFFIHNKIDHRLEKCKTSVKCKWIFEELVKNQMVQKFSNKKGLYLSSLKKVRFG